MDVRDVARRASLGGLAALTLQAAYLAFQLLVRSDRIAATDMAGFLGLPEPGALSLALLVTIACPATAVVAGVAEWRRDTGNRLLGLLLVVAGPLLALAVVATRGS